MWQPSPEEFAAWCENYVTRYVATAWLKLAQAQRQAWADSTWDSGEAPLDKLTELRARADAFLSMTEANWSDYERHLNSGS